MTATGNHIINKVIYHVHAVPVSKAFSIKEDAAAYIKGGFSNKLQAIFDKYFPGTDNIYIDKLQLDLTLMPGEINLVSYEKQLLDLLEKQLQKNSTVTQSHKTLKKEDHVEQSSKVVIQNAAKYNFTPADAFVFFLESGYLPWWCKVTMPSAFEKQVIAYLTTIGKETNRLIAKRIINAGQKIIYRFIHQFTDDFKFKLAAIFFQKPSNSIYVLHEKFTQTVIEFFVLSKKKQKKITENKAQTYTGQTIETATVFLFWNLCWHIIAAGKPFQKFETALNKTIEKMQTSANKPAAKNILLQKLTDKREEQQWEPDKNNTISAKRKKNDAAGEIFINNAGLVLLHPFLTTLFTTLLVAKDDKIIDHAKAITCLNYLCGYKAMQREYEWPLLKILCGMQISETVERLAELTDADKLECNALLQQVIDYWIALKQTSVEGLQQTFIQRFGKLSANENGWLLQVEQKTVDILKDRLPWGVSMVKLPWMKQLLMVEW